MSEPLNGHTPKNFSAQKSLSCTQFSVLVSFLNMKSRKESQDKERYHYHKREEKNKQSQKNVSNDRETFKKRTTVSITRGKRRYFTHKIEVGQWTEIEKKIALRN